MKSLLEKTSEAIDRSYRDVATNENKIKEFMDNFVASKIKDLSIEVDK